MDHFNDNSLLAVDAILAPDDGVFELPGAQPAWIWAHTCPTPNGECRTGHQGARLATW